jgi:hypothetical protein
VGYEADAARRRVSRPFQQVDPNGVRERRLRRALSLADALALAVALLVTVVIASPDELRPAALLLFPAVVAAAKILGLYDSDGQRIRKTTAEELPRLAQLGALLVLGVWLADNVLIGAQAGKNQATVLGVTFVATAILGRRGARRLTNRGLPRSAACSSATSCPTCAYARSSTATSWPPTSSHASRSRRRSSAKAPTASPRRCWSSSPPPTHTA